MRGSGGHEGIVEKGMSETGMAYSEASKNNFLASENLV